tara:strand:+ start:8149 stop:8541 length:393 start_codon:yes stop_codon:yes gene_type:complete
MSTNDIMSTGNDIKSQYNKTANGIKIGAIVGGVLGGVALIAFIVAVVIIVRRQNRRTAEKINMQHANARYAQPQPQQYTYSTTESAPMLEMEHPKDVRHHLQAQEMGGGVNQVHELRTGGPQELPARSNV